MRSPVTCSEKPPSFQWFFEWMSKATHPPSVILLKPGATGNIQPRGIIAEKTSSIRTPDSALRKPASSSNESIRFSLSVKMTAPLLFNAASP